MSHYRAQFLFTGVAGTPWYMTIRADADTLVPGTFGTALDDLLESLMAGLSNQVTGRFDGEVQILDDSTESVISIFNVPSFTYTGSNSGELLPTANQLLFRLNTAGIVTGPTGRTGRVKGRINIPGLCENQSDNGRWQLTVVNQFLANLNAFNAAAGMVVYSPTGQATFPVTGITGSQTVAILRSRRD